MLALYIRFYRSFAPATLVVTLACAGLFYKWGASILPALFFVKLLTNLLIWFLLKQLNEKKMYYYYNKHLPGARLWLFSFTLDFLLLVLLLSIITPNPTPIP